MLKGGGGWIVNESLIIRSRLSIQEKARKWWEKQEMKSIVFDCGWNKRAHSRSYSIAIFPARYTSVNGSWKKLLDNKGWDSVPLFYVPFNVASFFSPRVSWCLQWLIHVITNSPLSTVGRIQALASFASIPPTSFNPLCHDMHHVTVGI